MHMKKEPLFIAFASQKGGVGKTAFTVLTAGILRYQRGHNVTVVDCDPPQHSTDPTGNTHPMTNLM